MSNPAQSQRAQPKNHRCHTGNASFFEGFGTRIPGARIVRQ
jgi:hypothetical protein